MTPVKLVRHKSVHRSGVATVRVSYLLLPFIGFSHAIFIIYGRLRSQQPPRPGSLQNK
ncbi:hypothetical protein BDQ94DRAFT_149623 [Aspergillus welwitschiae]|uniref:Uncharacterized protein n=1 Tax=Aspergillus welwitschiae TaxID=1341132 RepID=A0A3F3PSE6_9EURO|nr:hypothetical protein BDQ94DRAFT_149623 [Aspergillus welwitschiae]RDH29860.1 hypothetical protein BDQ94DRAFT_149623 [Aspergillus welwitschiae]